MIRNINDVAALYECDVELLNRCVYKYTDCGAWIEWDDSGIRLGSIVEGSDDGVGPFNLRFPFTKKAYWNTLQRIEDDAAAAWAEANDDWE